MKKPELLVLGIDGASPAEVLSGVKKGELPGFERLIKKGVFFNDCMPVFPSISPTCWTSISTGAVPAVHKALCEVVHVKGTMPTEVITPYNSINVHAERFWEAAARIGKKSLMINVLSSGPAKSDLVMQIMGGNTVTPDKHPADSYISGISQQYFHIEEEKVYVSGTKTLSRQSNALEIENIKKKDNVYIFPVINMNPQNDPAEVEAFTWTIIVESDGVKLGEDEQAAEGCPVIREKQWSDVITRKLKTNEGCQASFHFRARLEEFDENSKSCVIYVTSSINLLKEVTPRRFAEEIQEIREIPLISERAVSLYRDWDVDKYIECESMVNEWHRKVITYCMEHYDNDIIFDWSGSIDTVNHRFRGIYERVAKDSEKQYDLACEAYNKVYKLIDDHIMWLLDNVVDEHTTFAVISDHGSVGAGEKVNHWQLLEKAGLIKYIDNCSEAKKWNINNVDWTQTKAYPVGSSYVNVNLKGREPCGIVEPEDYDKVVNMIIKALHDNVMTSDDHMTGLAFAVEKEQAGFVGLGGENCGDVVYGIIGSKLGGCIGGVHANQIPSARSKTGDIRATCIISGPNFKENEIIKRPADVTDLAPTLCYALGYPQPKDATGGVVFSAYKDAKDEKDGLNIKH